MVHAVFYCFFFIFYFWLCWVFTAAHRLSPVVASRVYSSLRCTGFSLWWLLLLWSMGSRCSGFISCGTRAQQLWLAGSRAQPQQSWRTGLVAPWHVGSSWTRARTRVPCIGRRIPNHCATREAPCYILDMWEFISSESSHTAHFYRKYTILRDFMDGFS